MPIETVIFLSFIVAAFGLFTATFVGVDLYTRDVRAAHRPPVPGE